MRFKGIYQCTYQIVAENYAELIEKLEENNFITKQRKAIREANDPK